MFCLVTLKILLTKCGGKIAKIDKKITKNPSWKIWNVRGWQYLLKSCTMKITNVLTWVYKAEYTKSRKKSYPIAWKGVPGKMAESWRWKKKISHHLDDAKSMMPASAGWPNANLVKKNLVANVQFCAHFMAHAFSFQQCLSFFSLL